MLSTTSRSTRSRKYSQQFFICCNGKYTGYMCFCQVISLILMFNRVLGILPIVPIKVPNHIHSCQFQVSKPWLHYSYCLQICYLIYFSTTSLMRMSCMSKQSVPSDWYVMTFGYILADLNNLIILFLGAIRAQRVCKLLQNLSVLYNSTKSLKELKKAAILITTALTTSYAFMVVSYLYVAWIRWKFENIPNTYCHLLDTSAGVSVRGITVVFSNIEILFCTLLCLIIIKQFNNLSQSICTYFKKKPKSGIELCLEQNNFSSLKLEDLFEKQESLIDYLEEINSCIGLQVLSEISTNLYTIVYYLYRYITASNGSITSNNREKYHYTISLIYRVTKLLIYVIVGHMVHINSKKPLTVLQQSKIITYPVQIQQQIQSLILQWSGRTSKLSAFGVLDVGPWLLAPILGDVITYLLVALQFKGPSKEKSTAL